MVKHIPAASIFADKFCHRAHQAHLRSLLSPRHYLSQLLAQGFSIAKHRTSYSIQYKHRHCYKREHSRPRLYALNPRLRKSKQPFRVAESFLAAKPPRIFLGRSLGTHPSIANKMPDTPFAFSIPLPTLRHIKPSRVVVAVTQTPKTAPSLIARQAQMLELDPIAVETDLYVVFGADNESNSQFIEQIHQFDIGEGAISRKEQSASGNRMKHLPDQRAHKVAFIAAAAIFKRVLIVCPPVDRYGARARAKGGHKKMLLIFNRPVNAETKSADQRQLRNDDARNLARHRIDIETRIMQKARESFAGSLKVVEETSQAGLTATPFGDKRKNKIYKSVALMAVCIVKDQVDILNKASGSRVLSHHNPILYRVYDSFPLAE
jgi:hypothetical protein